MCPRCLVGPWQLTTHTLWSAALYVLYPTGMAWSTNMEYGLFDLQIKLPMLVLPVLFLLRPRDLTTLLAPVGFAYVLGNVVAVLVDLLMVGFTYAQGTDMPIAQGIFSANFCTCSSQLLRHVPRTGARSVDLAARTSLGTHLAALERARRALLGRGVKR
ncbi:MAG: hypothetical protein IPN38_13035 [Flavobacteriales bacterium]|nr:hypothetical protein [Flavobacteriales bacterium]